MLAVEILESSDIEKAASVFHRDGFVCIKNPLSEEQFALNKAGAERVMQEQEDECGRENMNRGCARHSFGSQVHNREWCILIDLPSSSTQFDPRLDWRNYYRVFQFEHVKKPRERGSLVIEQKGTKKDLKLSSTAIAELSRSAYNSHTSADCIDRELIMPVNWTTERGHVPKMPWTATRIEGGIKEGGMTVKILGASPEAFEFPDLKIEGTKQASGN